jgi:hypothetical protein
MMKILPMVFTVFTVSVSLAETEFIEDSKYCTNGNSLSEDVTLTKNATFTVLSEGGERRLIRNGDDGGPTTVYSLSFFGIDQHTQLPSYMAFSQNGGYFFVVINSQNEVVSIIQNDRDFDKCGGGLVVIQLSSVATES